MTNSGSPNLNISGTLNLIQGGHSYLDPWGTLHWALRAASVGQPQSLWNQKILLMKFFRYDPTIIKIPLIVWLTY